MRYEWKDTGHGPQLWDSERRCWAIWYGIGAIGMSDEIKAEITAALNPCWGAADELVAALREDLSEARHHAKVLAHAYTTDNRPPQEIVDKCLKYP